MEDYIEYPYRFTMIILFALPSAINGMCWVVFTSISSKIANVYEVPDFQVTMVSMIYMIVFIIVNFPSNWILDTKGIRKGIIIGAVMTALGAAIRCLVNLSFVYVLIGQIFCAIGQPFILNAPGKIATFWFKEQNRPIATAVLSVINIIGTGIGFLVPSIIVQEDSTPQKAKSQTFILLIFQFGLSFVGALLIILFFKEKPKTPPSFGAKSEKTQFKKSIKILAGNRNFLFLFIGFSVLNGIFNYFGALLNFIIKPFGYSDDQISYLGVCFIVVGLVSSFILSLYVQKTNRYKIVFIFCAIISVIGQICQTFLLYRFNQYYIVMISVFIIGFGLTPLLPLSIDFGCQIVFPIGEALITGILMTGGQIVGITLILVIQQGYGLDDKYHAYIANMIVTIVLSVGLLGYFFVKEDLKRKNAQAENKSNSIKESLISTVTQ